MLVLTSSSGRSLLAVAALVALFALSAILPEVDAGQEGDDVEKVADALRILQELDRYYSNVARPRTDKLSHLPERILKHVKIFRLTNNYVDRLERRDAGGAIDADLLDRAIRILQLQSLDRLYAHQTRPRFGKRSGLSSILGRQQQKDVDADDWLKYAKRR